MCFAVNMSLKRGGMKEIVLTDSPRGEVIWKFYKLPSY